MCGGQRDWGEPTASGTRPFAGRQWSETHLQALNQRLPKFDFLADDLNAMRVRPSNHVRLLTLIAAPEYQTNDQGGHDVAHQQNHAHPEFERNKKERENAAHQECQGDDNCHWVHCQMRFFDYFRARKNIRGLADVTCV